MSSPFIIPLWWQPPPWQPPEGFPPLPVCWEWHEGDPLPDWLSFVKGNLDEDMYFKVCLESINPPKLTVTKRNIAEIDFAFHGCFRWFGRWTHDPEGCAKQAEDYVRKYHPRMDVEIDSDLKEEKICFVLPSTWVLRTLYAKGVPVPFEKTDNKVCFTLKHESPTLVTLELVTESQQILEQTVSTATTLIFTVMVVLMLMSLLTTVIKEFKWK